MPKKTAKKVAKKTTKKVAKKATKKVAKKAAKKTAKKDVKSVSAKTKISEDQVSHAAYLNYASRIETGTYGDEIGDWLAAEQSLGIKRK